MAKASMRPETKAAKLRNNKSSLIAIICQTPKCENEAIVHCGSHDNRNKKCWPCWSNPQPSGRQSKRLAELKSWGIV